MSKKTKIPKISDKELQKLTQAVQFAFGNQTADELLDEALALLPHYREDVHKSDEQTRAE